MNTQRQAAANATKQKLIDTTFIIISEQGYEAITSNLLVQRAGVAKGTLYHHFDSLEDVVAAMFSQVTDSFMNEVPIENYTSLSAYLHAVGEYAMHVANNERGVLNVFFGFVPKAISNEHYQMVAKQFILRACAQISPAINNMYQHLIADDKVDNVVRMIDMFLMGFVSHQAIFNDPQRYHAIWQTFSDMVVQHVES